MKPHDREAYLAACSQCSTDSAFRWSAAVEDYVRSREHRRQRITGGDGDRIHPRISARSSAAPPCPRSSTQLLKQQAAGRRSAGATSASSAPSSTGSPPPTRPDPRRHLVRHRRLAARLSTSARSTRNSMLLYVNMLFSFAWSRTTCPKASRPPPSQSRKVKVQERRRGDLHARTSSARSSTPRRRTSFPLLAIGAFAGIRMAELARLDWNAVDLERGLIEVRAGQAKTASRRLVPITDNLAAWLEPLPRKGKVIAIDRTARTRRPRSPAPSGSNGRATCCATRSSATGSPT